MYSVLLVDDEPLVLEGLKLLVDWESCGFRVCDEASDGEEAIMKIAEQHPDLVVTDLRMPVIDGIQLIRHCVQQLRLRSRFVILSGHEDFSAAQQAVSLGVIDYWLKPIDAEEIHRSLAALHKSWTQRGPVYRAPAGDARASGDAWPTAAESVPAVPDEALCAAEDELLQAIEDNDGQRIAAIIRRMLDLAASAIPSVIARQSYFSSLLLELILKTDDGVATDAMPISMAFLKNEPDTWEEPLTAFCQTVAARLARQRESAGPVGEALRFIRKNYNKPLKLQEVAKALHFQPAYMGQLFRKVTGMSFLDCLHRTRIEEACKLLRRTDRKISDIARAVGYADAELFTEKFKKYMSVPPSQYKK
jgi:two-component system response regulator YesN